MRAMFILAMLLLAAPAHAQIRSVTLQPLSRDFGYFAGDIVACTAIIDVGPDTMLDRGSLPYAGPVTTSIDLRAITVREEAIPGGRRITIHTEYQNFATPDEVSRVDVPGYQIALGQGQKRLTASVPGFGFAVSPFRHDLLETVDLSVLRADHAPLMADVSGSRLELLAGSGLALLSLACLALMLGRLPGTRRRRAPFANAARQLRTADRRDSGREALLLLHRAFDETAGERVLPEDLDRFLERAPRFASLRADISRFFDLSRDYFFRGTDAQAMPAAGELAAFCRNLARAERRS